MNAPAENDKQSSNLFPPFRFNPSSGELWQGDKPVLLRPKTGAVLDCLLKRQGQVVTRAELCRAVWPGSHGSEQAPKQCIRELRVILGDTTTTPRFIETVGRRGYRFIGSLDLPDGLNEPPKESTAVTVPARICMGRDAELANLRACLKRIRRGERQVVFITGEPGIGKTTLIENFIESLAGQDLWIASGQCVPHHGAAEAYGPLLDALSQLARGATGPRLVPLLERYAPTWLKALPGLDWDKKRNTLESRARSTGPEGMRRELIEALEAFFAERPGILVLEDLHWSDSATLDWLTAWAERRMPGPVLVLGSYRSVEVLHEENPVLRIEHELRRRGRCLTLALAGLGKDTVSTYLRMRVGETASRPELGHLLRSRTEGHPLFLEALLNEWRARGLLEIEDGNELSEKLTDLAATVPPSVRELIEHQFRSLPDDERRLLETASAAGLAFPAAAVAAGLGAGLESVEETCARLAARQLFLTPAEPEQWPDGTVTARFAFRHALHRQVIHDGLPAGRRAGLHRRIGLCLETGYGAETGWIAVRLAEHFVEGSDPVRATRYLRAAGDTALARQAHREAVDHLRQGLMLIERWPESPERFKQELHFQTALGAALIGLEGFGTKAVASAYRRAFRLCRKSAESLVLVPTLCGLWNYFVTRADFRLARIVSERLQEIIRQTSDPALCLPAHNAVGQTHLFMGEPAAAEAHIDVVLKYYDARKHGRLAIEYGEDPGVVCRMYAALTCWLLGYPETARRHIEAGMALATRLEHPFGQAQMIWMDAIVAQCAGDSVQVREQTKALIALCQEHEIGFWLPSGRVFEGWGLAEAGQSAEGIATIREGLYHWQASGAKIFQSYHLALLAQAHGDDGRPNQGLAVLDSALAETRRTHELWYQAELFRLKAELGIGQGEAATGAAVTFFQRSLALARQQGAKSLELRAATGLARLWQTQGRFSAAYELLAPVHGWFTEGLDTADIREAGELLRHLKGKGSCDHGASPR
ncbi:MAG: AAA family ATPase [Gammaproteobacteria bacterium]